MNTSKLQQGYTLVELLLIMTILAILGTIAALNAWPMLDSYRVNDAIRQIMGDLQQTKLNAMKNNKNWVLEFDGNTSCLKNNKGTNNAWDNGCTISGPMDDTLVNSRQYMIVSITAVPIRAEFKPDGTCSADFTVTVCKGKPGKQIHINQFNGNIQVTASPTACPL